jgi:cytochrome P450
MNIFPSPYQILNPFPFYAEMRKFHPIEYDEKNETWGIFRYNDIQSILTDYRNFSSDIQKSVNIQQEQEIQKAREPQDHKNRRPLRSSLLTSDPPRHSQLRRVISSAFSPNTIYKLKPRIEQICHDMIDNVIEQGHMDLINDLSYPLPVTVIAGLLGIPAQDQDTFKKWADDLLGSTRGSSNNLPTDKDSQKIFARVQSEMDLYFNNIIEKRRIQKQLSSSNDLIDNLLRAEIDGNKLSGKDILAFCSLLLLAGHVTTVNLISNAVRSLLEYPQQLKQLLLLQTNGNLHKDYDSLISSAIEETLRYRSPVQGVFRFATHDVTLGGQGQGKEKAIQRGQRMIMWIGSANHDESIFTNAEIFDINRNTTDTHLAFGHGIHFCLGSILATLEAQVVLKIILDRLHNLRFANEYNEELLKPLHGVFFHGVSNLPLCFESNSPIKKSLL